MTFMKGEKVELRVLEDKDAEPFTKAVNAGLTTEHLFTGSIPMRTADYRQRWEEERKAGDILFGVWAGIYERPDQLEFVGTSGIHSYKPYYDSGEFRVLIFSLDAVGKGIGKEVVRLTQKYAFERLNLNRLWLGVSAINKRAVKCYIDGDYLFEGRSDDAIYYAGSRKPTYSMRILRDEWQSIATS